MYKVLGTKCRLVHARQIFYQSTLPIPCQGPSKYSMLPMPPPACQSTVGVYCCLHGSTFSGCSPRLGCHCVTCSPGFDHASATYTFHIFRPGTVAGRPLSSPGNLNTCIPFWQTFCFAISCFWWPWFLGQRASIGVGVHTDNLNSKIIELQPWMARSCLYSCSYCACAATHLCSWESLPAQT